MSYRELAQKYGVNEKTARRTVEDDPEMAEKAAHKKRANEQEILAYMDGQKDMVCRIIGMGLEALCDRDKMAEATPSQITTALGTLIDKWTQLAQAQGQGGGQSLADAIEDAYMKRTGGDGDA